MNRLGLFAASLALAFAAIPASAQDKFPSKTVKIVVPYAPGGGTDITSRRGEQLRNILGQSFVVENKPGAIGILGIEEMVGRSRTATRSSSPTRRPTRSRRCCSEDV